MIESRAVLTMGGMNSYDGYPDLRRASHGKDDITRRIRIGTPTFDGHQDPKAFSDWLQEIDHYFEWYDMTEERCVRFARMKLVGPAKIF